MIKNEKLDFLPNKILLTRWINTDEIEKANWKTRQQNGKGFIFDKGKLSAREIAQIPVEEAEMLRTLHDQDFSEFEETHSKEALRRLLKRFPHWKTAEGGI